MTISPHTTSLIDEIERNANKPLRFRMEVAQLVELAKQHNDLPSLEELSFHAKFAYKTLGIMKRIGKDGDGYDKLSNEFNESVETAKRFALGLLHHAPQEVLQHFESTFFFITPDCFQDLLLLFHDLSWYKNYLIDIRAK
jgi:hypothetical protein